MHKVPVLYALDVRWVWTVPGMMIILHACRLGGCSRRCEKREQNPFTHAIIVHVLCSRVRRTFYRWIFFVYPNKRIYYIGYYTRYDYFTWMSARAHVCASERYSRRPKNRVFVSRGLSLRAYYDNAVARHLLVWSRRDSAGYCIFAPPPCIIIRVRLYRIVAFHQQLYNNWYLRPNSTHLLHSRMREKPAQKGYIIISYAVHD